jgi:hypothetical protein
VATRTPAKSSGGQGGNFGSGSSAGSMDVGVHAVARMAREDTRWFVVGVVTLSIVLFLALPVSMLVIVDYMKLRSEIQYEIKQVRKLKEDLRKEKSNVANSSGNRSEPN